MNKLQHNKDNIVALRLIKMRFTIVINHHQLDFLGKKKIAVGPLSYNYGPQIHVNFLCKNNTKEILLCKSL